MARTKQTARRSTGGKAPRQQSASSGALRQTGAVTTAAYQHQQQQQQQQQHQQERGGGGGGGGESQEPIAFTFTGTYDTVFYAHYFSTGPRETQHDVGCRYALAHTLDPLTPGHPDDWWLGVSYNSKYDGPGMFSNASQGSGVARTSNRPDLNLVVALDVGGSF